VERYNHGTSVSVQPSSFEYVVQARVGHRVKGFGHVDENHVQQKTLLGTLLLELSK